MGQTPTPTKPATTPEPTPKATHEEVEPAGEPEPDPKPFPTPKGSRNVPPTAFDKMAATARRILSKNPDIVERMLEYLRTNPLVPL